jgi:hypothetical protein
MAQIHIFTPLQTHMGTTTTHELKPKEHYKNYVLGNCNRPAHATWDMKQYSARQGYIQRAHIQQTSKHETSYYKYLHFGASITGDFTLYISTEVHFYPSTVAVTTEWRNQPSYQVSSVLFVLATKSLDIQEPHLDWSCVKSITIPSPAMVSSRRELTNSLFSLRELTTWPASISPFPHFLFPISHFLVPGFITTPLCGTGFP